MFASLEVQPQVFLILVLTQFPPLVSSLPPVDGAYCKALYESVAD